MHRRAANAVLLLLAPILTARAQSPIPDSFSPAVDAYVFSLALQVDGKVLVGGEFATLDGQSRSCLGQVNGDGTLDSGFDPGAVGYWVSCIAVQPDGKVLVGGNFTSLAGQSRTNIGRLNNDGTLDASFNPATGGSYPYVYALALQADGKILVGGFFDFLGGQIRHHIARLNNDGTLDTSFNPGTDNRVSCLAVQPDGRVLVGGTFGTLSGQSRTNLGRLNADGTLDETFNPVVGGESSSVSCLAIQADGKVLVGGFFNVLGGQSFDYIGRLNADGTADAAFGSAANDLVYSLALQADGKIIVSGFFTTLNGENRSYLGRLNPDGTLDAAFNPGASGPVLPLALQTDGKILLGGYFTNLAGLKRSYLGRLNNTETALDNLSFDGSTLTWSRGGACPEVWRTSADYSLDGNTWTNLGTPIRVPGGWEIATPALASNTTFRARGYVAGGYGNNSAWLTESMIGPPGISREPANRTNDFGTSATLSVYAGGDLPLAYQWFKNGVPLSDGGDVTGAATANLTLTSVQEGDAASYSVVITNASGVVTSLVATLTVIDPWIKVQPLSQSISPGQSVTLNVTAIGTTPFSYQWRKEGLPRAGATQPSLTIAAFQPSDAGNYDVVVTNTSGSVTSSVAVLSLNGPLDFSFNPGANGGVSALSIQADGRILVGGYFSALGGQSRSNIGRLNADGTLDNTFHPGVGGTAPNVSCLAEQGDGKILVAGSFSSLGGKTRTSIGRLNPEGTLDESFNPSANGLVSGLALQADAKILVAGYFTALNGQNRRALGRLNPDGSLDTNFSPMVNGPVYCLALQPDGKVLIGGLFNNLDGLSRTNIGRLNADGTLDAPFNPSAGGFSANVACLVLQADGKILVGGTFTTLDGQIHRGLGRLNPDGKVDATFNATVIGGASSVFTLALQTDGQILAGGNFSGIDGQPRNYLGRLRADGTLESTFDAAASGPVLALALQADGKILLGGFFNFLGGQNRNFIGRLYNTEAAAQNLVFDGSSLSWTRGGACPEVWLASFAYTPDGDTWVDLGGPARAPWGWQLTGLFLPLNSTFRARGYIAGGYHNGSGWITETIIGPPGISAQPDNLTVNFGATATFSVYAGGNTPLAYQWRKDGIDLADGGAVAGASTTSLTLSNVRGGNAGGYSVLITNAAGAVTSLVATLTVVDPWIKFQPVSQSRNLGDSVTFTVTPVGTAPFNYQWRREGAPIDAATQSSLTLADLQASDATSYDVVVTNASGSAISTPATLSINLAPADSFNPLSDSSVLSLALQADGKIVVGGSFGTLGGQGRNHLGRLNPDGTLDTGFNPGADDAVNCLGVQADGKLLVGGNFSHLAGQAQSFIGRLNADGTLDAGFQAGADYYVDCLALQADGRILLGGNFTQLGGQSRNHLGRLNVDGTVDASFNPGANAYVDCLAVQPDGKVLVGGYFTALGGQSRSYIGRLNADGTLDAGFNPGADSYVYCLGVQADGRILAGGHFSLLGGQTFSFFGRLNPSGALDTSFNPLPNSGVSSLAIQADGRILVGGNFTTVGGQTRNRLARLNPDGTLDNNFFPAASGPVTALALQVDGNILVGGQFNTLSGQNRSYLGRLANTLPAAQNLSFDGSALTWMRGGTSPEVWRTTFDYSPDLGASWISLGTGSRIAGGWQLAVPSLPTNTVFRARGYAVGGDWNASSWYVENFLAPPPTIQPILALITSGGLPQVILFGDLGRPYALEFVQTLQTTNSWQPLTSLLLTNNPQPLLDLSAINSPQRFYRARLNQ